MHYNFFKELLREESKIPTFVRIVFFFPGGVQRTMVLKVFAIASVQIPKSACVPNA